MFCEDTHNHHGAFKKKRLTDICSGTRVMMILKKRTFRRRHSNLQFLRPLYIFLYYQPVSMPLAVYRLNFLFYLYDFSPEKDPLDVLLLRLVLYVVALPTGDGLQPPHQGLHEVHQVLPPLILSIKWFYSQGFCYLFLGLTILHLFTMFFLNWCSGLESLLLHPHGLHF